MIKTIWSKGSGQGITVEVAEVSGHVLESSYGIYENAAGTSRLIYDRLYTKNDAIKAAKAHLAGEKVSAHLVSESHLLKR